MANVEKLSISLEQELADFVRARAEEAGQSISAYIAVRLERDYRNHRLGKWMDEEGIAADASELDLKRARLRLLEADLQGAQEDVERVRAEIARLEASRPGPKPASPKGAAKKRPAKKRRAA